MLKDLHMSGKMCVARTLKTRYYKKGETMFIKNFPKIDFLLIIEGRMEIKWFDLTDKESLEDS